MLACLVASAAELFKGGMFIINKVSLLACGTYDPELDSQS